jgi:hypothetical protein
VRQHQSPLPRPQGIAEWIGVFAIGLMVVAGITLVCIFFDF